jgi:hypothetical protein
MHVAKIRQGVPHVVGQAAARVLLQGPNHRKLEVLVVMQAGVAAEAHQKNQIGASGALYHAPPLAIERLSLTPQGNIRYALKT